MNYDTIIEAGVKSAKTEEAKWRIEDIQIYEFYAEPGYGSDKPIAVGNWNDISKWNEDESKSEEIDDTPSRVGNLLEKSGYELEWSDEWISCDECGGAVRTRSDCWEWTPYYYQNNDGTFCVNCIKKDPSYYLEEIEGTCKCDTLDIDLEENGYQKIDIDFENGIYGGQCADPQEIAKSLEKLNISKYIFQIDSKGQFDISFSVWVSNDEVEEFGGIESLTESLENENTDGVDPAEMMKEGLKKAPFQSSQGGVVVSHIDLSDGSVETKILTSQEFVEGKSI